MALSSLLRLTAAAGIALGVGLLSLQTAASDTTRPPTGAASSLATRTPILDVGGYRATIVFTPTTGTPRAATITLRDRSGEIVAGKPLTGILAYTGSEAGHEHNDILISREAVPGRYELALDEVVSGSWKLTIAIGNEARVAYAFSTD